MEANRAGLMSENFALCDRRRLEFRGEAIATALEALGPSVLSLPAGRPVAVNFVPTRSVVEATYATEAGSQTIEISATSLVAVLIGYCAGIQTPMPRQAEKSLVVAADHAVLSLVLRFRHAPRMMRALRIGSDRTREGARAPAGADWAR